MHRATYSFKHENVKIIPFKADDLFVVLKENDNGWWLCLANNGRIGLVPSNYIEPSQPEPNDVLDFIEQASTLAPKHQHYFSVDYLPLANSFLGRLKKKCSEPKQHSSNTSQISSPTSPSSSLTSQYAPTSSSSSSRTSSSSLPPTPLVLPLSPSTPKTPTQQQQQQHLGDACNLKHQQQQQSQNNNNNDNKTSQQLISNESKIPKESKLTKDSKLPDNLFWSLVTKIRECTDINFENSRNVLKMLLSELSLIQPSWIDVIGSLLDQENIDIKEAINAKNYVNNVINDDDDGNDGDDGGDGGDDGGVLDIQLSLQSILLNSRDSQDLTQIFDKVGQVTEDGQQSSWCLFEDFEANTQLLNELLSILRNANESLCNAILSRDQYAPCHHLVQYYQMETRDPLRRLLIQVFARICSLGDRFISELLNSVLPLELARQLMSHANHLSLDDVIGLLCILFSTAEAIPQQHYSCFNQEFLTHILELIENETSFSQNETDSPQNETVFSQREKLIEMLIFFNQHLEKPEDNICMDALRGRTSHKHLTEYLLLLFNRGGPSKTTQPTLKFLIDIFSHRSTAHIFYTNDANVLVDIIYRQVHDLCAGEEARTQHLKLLHLFLIHSEYWENPHRRSDIQQGIQQIYLEDPACMQDKRISKEVLVLFETFDAGCRDLI